MAAIYLKHDKHGNKVAVSEEEAKADEKNGWKRYEVKDPEGKTKDPEGWNARMREEERASMVRWEKEQKDRVRA